MALIKCGESFRRSGWAALCHPEQWSKRYLVVDVAKKYLQAQATGVLSDRWLDLVKAELLSPRTSSSGTVRKAAAVRAASCGDRDAPCWRVTPLGRRGATHIRLCYVERSAKGADGPTRLPCE